MLVKEDSTKKISFHFSGKNQFSYFKIFLPLSFRLLSYLTLFIGKAKWQKKCDYHGNEREKHL